MQQVTQTKRTFLHYVRYERIVKLLAEKNFKD